MAFSEAAFLELVRASFAAPCAGVELAIGDDAAVLSPSAAAVCVTADMLIEGIDFRVAECGLRRAGAKAVNKNLSDLAAMGVAPWCCFLSVALPPATDAAQAAELLAGLRDAALAGDCPIVGGDTKRSPGPLILSIQALGRATAGVPVRRSGARAGDVLLVTGRLGGAALGHHLDFAPRVAAGLRLNGVHRVAAMIDVSDGLSTDLHHLCAASGVGAELDAAAIPLAPAAHTLGARDGREALQHALHDGEDYELLFAASPAAALAILADPALGVPVTRIGRCVEAAAGITLRTATGSAPLARGGFEHRFGSAPP